MSSRGICLVIEDNEDIAGLLDLILTGLGFDVHVTSKGTEGLIAAAALKPDLITLDVGLPDMDGRDVALRLRDITAAPILMITAYADFVAELEGMASGASAYLSKPFRPAQLRELVHQLCPEEETYDTPTNKPTAAINGPK